METKEEENKALMEAISYLLQTTEEIKAYLPTIKDTQTELYVLIKKQAEDTSNLAKIFFKTKRDLSNRLDNVETCGTKMGAELENHQKRLMMMEEKLKNIEFEGLTEFLSKLKKKVKFTTEDLKIVNNKLQMFPSEEGIIYVKSLILEDLGKNKELDIFLEKAVQKNSQSCVLWYRWSKITKDAQKKIPYLKNASNLLENQEISLQHAVLHDYALYQYRNKESQPALDNITRAMEIDPSCALGWDLKGGILIKLNRISEALGCFETGLKNDDTNASLWDSKGDALFNLGSEHYEEALACFNKAIALDSKDEFSHLHKGKLLLALKKNKEALKSLDEARKINRENLCVNFYLSQALIKLERFDEAINNLKPLLSETDGYVCLAGIGLLCSIMASKKTDEFLKLYRRISQKTNLMNKLNPETRATIANEFAFSLFMQKKDLAIALKEIKDAIRLLPDNAALLDTKACILQAMGKDLEANKLFEKALSLRKDDKDINWMVLGTLYQRIGKKKEAIKAFETAKKIGQNLNYTP